LKRIYLNGLKVTNADMANLAGLVRVRELHIKDSEVTSAGLAHLRGMTQLERLDLNRGRVVDLAMMPRLAKLTILDLRGCEKIGLSRLVKLGTSDHPGLGWRAKLRAMFWAMANHVATDLTFSRPRTMNCPRPRLRAWALTHSAVAALSL
jgi:hypothetical protein